jgi:hypothetical protein
LLARAFEPFYSTKDTGRGLELPPNAWVPASVHTPFDLASLTLGQRLGEAGPEQLALTGIVDEGEEVLVPSPTYPLYTAVLAKIGAQPAYYRTDHTNSWQPDLDHLRVRREARPSLRGGVDLRELRSAVGHQSDPR